MSSAMTHPEQGFLGLMEDLAGMLRTEVLPTHLALVQLIGKICEDPTLKQVDLYSKYTRLAAVVGGDWITVKEELRNATHFGAAAFYCSISAMLAVFTCRRSRSHDELVSSLTELYNHISAGNEILNKQVEYAITTMGKQIEHANVAEASIATIIDQADHVKTVMEKQVEQVNKAETSIANFNEQVNNAITTMEKQEEQNKKAEESITTIIKQADHVKTVMEKQVEQVNKAEVGIAKVIERADNVVNTVNKQINQSNIAETTITASTSPTEFTQDKKNVVAVPGTKFRCKYGTLTIDDKYNLDFNSVSLEAKVLGLWLTLPIPLLYRTRLMNVDHEHLIRTSTTKNLSVLHAFKHDYDDLQKKKFMDNLFINVKYKAGQWTYIC